MGVDEGVGKAIVGLGVAGGNVFDGVREGVETAVGDGEGVGDGTLAVGVPDAVALGLADGAAHAAASPRMRSATTC